MTDRAPTDWRSVLLRTASRPYLTVSRSAYFFARGKLGSDPIYQAILEHGLLHGRDRILDLGCGRSLLTAWLLAAHRIRDQGVLPSAWPPVPRPRSTRGIEHNQRDVNRARLALGPAADITWGDIRETPFGEADAVVLLDVMHYLPKETQRSVLARVRLALPLGGLLLMRVSDANAGWRHRYAGWVDRMVLLFRGELPHAPECRTIPDWQKLLKDCRFDCDTQPMSRGTPFANVLILAHAV